MLSYAVNSSRKIQLLNLPYLINKDLIVELPSFMYLTKNIFLSSKFVLLPLSRVYKNNFPKFYAYRIEGSKSFAQYA